MGFYGEIINTGDSPFTFDKIYSSRYHMEQAMAEDGIYSGRFVLISYDSSYMHNNFKRAYIKEEDKNKKSAITLYRDSTCNKPILYKDFDDESENAGDSLAATLANVYYVKDDYFYTYYKCVDKNNDVAVFDYYMEMNTLYKEAFRDDKSMDASKIRLYLDKNHEETIKTYKQDAKNGVYKGDIVFVHETALEQSAQEKSEGVFSYYECTDAENGDALFEKIAQIIGHFKDETLENYIMNQKLDSMYYGLEGGVHNYDKTVWQKVYIGEKEQYIKIASLNSEIPKLNISVDAPEATISTAPYFDTDVNGAVEDLHIQPQWGFRIAAANKALSSFGATENTGTGNYVGYVDVVKNESNDFCEQLLLLQDERIRNREASKNFVSTSLSEYLNQNQLSSNNSSVSLKTFEDVLNGNFQPIIDNVNNYLFNTEETIIYPEYIKDYSLEQDEEKIYYIYNDVTNSYDIIEFTSNEESVSYSPGTYYYKLENTPQENLFLKCTEYYDSYDIKSDAVFDPDILVDELTYGPIDDEIFYNQDNFSFVEELSNQDYYNLILLGYDNIEETILPNLFEYFNQFIRLLDNYAVSLKTINSGFNNNVIKLSWNSSFKVRSVLNLIFDFPFEKETALIDGQENSEETYNPSILQTPFVKQETILDENNKEEVVNNIIKDILAIVDEYSALESDENIIWKAKKDDSSYSTFNGHEWVDSKESFPGAIYYNKAGFDPNVSSKSETNDYINITPSGFSQVYDAGEDIWSNKKYTNPNSDFTAEKIEAPDVQELSIHLPSIGNAVSDMWDIVYGEGEDDGTGKKIRKTNVDWDISGESYNDRLRLVQDGNERGLTYSQENVATIAGAINSVQDLMGRIIVEDFNNFTTIDDEELTSKLIKDKLNSNTIYYFSDDQKYYSVKNKYDFESEYPEEKKIKNEQEYLEKIQGYTLANDLIDPNNMKTNLYYYDSMNLRYIYEKQYIKDESYVTLEAEEVNFASNPEIDEYLLDNDSNLIKPNDNGWGNGEYYNLTNKIIGPTYLFIPGEYYIDNPNYDPNVANGENQYIAPTYFDPSKIYYVRKGESSIGKNPITGEIIPATNIMEPVYYPKPAENETDLHPNLHTPLLTINKDHSSQELVYNCYIKASEDITKLSDLFAEAQFSTVEFDTDVIDNSYRRLLEEIPFGDADITPADDQNNNDRIFYGVLTSDFSQENIIPKYEKDTYYYKVEPVTDGSMHYYQLDTSDAGDASKLYYKLNNIINQELELYESGKYYVKTEDNIYIKDIGDFNSATEYYKHNVYYVTKDYAEIYKQGQMWDYTIPWKEYLLDNGNEIGTVIEGVDELNNSITQYKDYYYDSEGRHQVNFIELFDSSKYYKIVDNYEYDINSTKTEDREYFYPKAAGSKEPNGVVTFYEPNKYFGVNSTEKYFKLDNSEIPTRKTYYYNAANTNPVYFYGNNVSAIDLEFSKVIQSGNYYIYNHNDNFEEVSKTASDVQNRTYQGDFIKINWDTYPNFDSKISYYNASKEKLQNFTQSDFVTASLNRDDIYILRTYYYDNQAEEKVYFKHLWQTYIDNGEKFYIANFEQDTNSTITANRNYYKWDRTKAYLSEQFSQYYTNLIIDNPNYNKYVVATSYTNGTNYYLNSNGTGLIQYWEDEFNSYRDNIYIANPDSAAAETTPYITASNTAYDENQIYYADEFGSNIITIVNKTTDTYYYLDTRQYIPAPSAYNSDTVYRFASDYTICQIYSYTPGIFYFFNDEAHKDNDNYRYIQQTVYNENKQYYVSYPTNWVPGQNLKSIQFLDKNSFPGDGTYYLIDNEDANRQKYLPVSTTATYSKADTYYEKIGNEYIIRLFELWQPSVFYYELQDDIPEDVNQKPITICSEAFAITGKNYYATYKDALIATNPVILENYKANTYLYNNFANPNYELVGDGVKYSPYTKYFIKLTATSTPNEFVDSSGKIYKTALIDGNLYDITEYEFDYKQNLDQLSIIVINNNNYYLPQKFESWVAGKFYWENNYSEIIISSELVNEDDLNEIYYFEELEGFSRRYNTINGLILQFNKALGSKDPSSRNLNTLYGCINRLNDEIRRLQIYDSGTISMINNSILSSFQTAKKLTQEIIDLRQQANGAYGGLLTEVEAVKNYANINDFNSIVGFNLDNGRGTNQDNTSGVLLYNPLTGRQIEGFENPNNSIIGEIADINKRAAKTDVLTNLLGLELTEDTIVTDFNKATTDKLNLPKIIEDGVSISPNISQSINYLYGKIDNIESSLYGHEDNKVTIYNLTNSAWTFKETISTDSLTGEVFNIAFKCNEVTYQKLNIGTDNIKYDDTWAYSSEGGWFSNKTNIIITGGADVKNQELYEWLNEVAVATVAPAAEEKELESYFGPGSSLVAELESLNKNGLLARMAVLDSNIDKLSDNLKDKVTTLRTDYQTNVMNQVINVTPSGGGGSSSGGSAGEGSNNQTGTISGKELSKPVIVDSLDSSYGFRYSNSQFLWSQDEIKYTLNYEIKLYFSPTTAKTFTDLPVLKLKEFGPDGGILFNRAHYLTIKNDDGSPNLDAYIAYDGTIYVSCNSTMQAVSPASAYEYTLSGSIVEQLYEYDGEVKKLKSENALTIYFGNDKGVLASYANFPTIAQTFTNVSGSFFNIPKGSDPPKGYKFKCWRLCDNSTNKTPVLDNGKYIDYNIAQMVDTQVTVSEKDSDWTKIYDTASNKLKGNYFVPIYESDGSEVYIVDGVYYNCAKGTSVKTFAANTKWKLVQSAKTTGKTSAAYYLTTSVKYSKKTSKKITYNGSSKKKQNLYILKNRWGSKIKSTGTALNKIFTTSVQDKTSNSGCWYRTMKATPISSTKSYYLINQK